MIKDSNGGADAGMRGISKARFVYISIIVVVEEFDGAARCTVYNTDFKKKFRFCSPALASVRRKETIDRTILS